MVAFVDNRAERFGAAVTIADLAAFTFANRFPSRLCAAAAFALVRHVWPWEAESIIAQNGVGIDVLFRDGSHLSVPALRNSSRRPPSHWRFTPPA